MRIIFSILIFFQIIIISLSGFSSSSAIEKNQLTIFQARGLRQHACYDEMVAISCKENCVLTLFPNTKAQLDLRISKMPKSTRSKMGHFFHVKFKVKNEGASDVELYSANEITFKKLKKSITQADGLVRDVKCVDRGLINH